MRNGDLTYDDFLQRLNIQDILIDAGYRLNRRDGLRYPSYVRTDSEGRRIRGDKFIVTANGQCCFQPPQQKLYNIISFIKEHPHLFAEYRAGISPDRLVNLVCCRLLNHPIEERSTRIIQPRRDIRPFNIDNYELHKFNPQDRETQKRFYPYFKNRGIDLYTQYAFHRYFFLATRHREDGTAYTNLSFPLIQPKEPDKTVGFEERGRPRMDGSGSYKGKAEGSNSNEGLWAASPAHTKPADAKDIYWFESAYDAMAYYQLHQKGNKDLRKAVFVSTGGAPSRQQFKGMIEAAPQASHHLCFDRDRAGRIYAVTFALVHDGREFTSFTPEADMLVIQETGTEKQRHEIKLEPYDFDKIAGTLGIEPIKTYSEEAVKFYMEKIGDGYLGEVYMNRMDDYKQNLQEGKASEEELEKQREGLANIREAMRRLDSTEPCATGNILYEPAADGYKDWNEQLLHKGKPVDEKADEHQDISGKATLTHALEALPEVNPEHIRNGTYDEADYKAVRQRIERADKIIFSFEIQDQGMPEKGFQEMYKIREELSRLEKEISDSLSGIREDNQPRFHR